MRRPFVYRHHDGRNGILESDLLICPEREWGEPEESTPSLSPAASVPTARDSALSSSPARSR